MLVDLAGSERLKDSVGEVCASARACVCNMLSVKYVIVLLEDCVFMSAHPSSRLHRGPPAL